VADTAPRGTSAPLRLGSLNVVVLIGRVTMDPDLRYTPKGTAVLNYRIAVNRRYKDKATDEWKDDTSYFNVNAWGAQAERLGEQMKKGSAVLVEGQLRSRSWETQAGEKRYSVEIWSNRTQVLDKFNAEAGAAPATTEEEPDIPKDQLDDIPF
jgi:single-strand DNA-binding protein